MLVWGTVNPAGEQGGNYCGFYLTDDDIRRLVRTGEVVDKPVRIEHKEGDVGRVVSVWRNGRGQMDCLLELHQRNLQSSVISKFVDEGFCRELSLGYVVDVQHSGGRMRASNKRVVEISIVKKGARESCFIHGFSASTPAS